MDQFGKILKFELKNYFASKAFVGVTLFMVVAIVAVMFFPRITEAFDQGEQEDAETEEMSSAEDSGIMLIKAEEQETADGIAQAFTAAFSDYEVQVTQEDLGQIKERIKEGDAACAFVFDDATNYTYYVDNLSMYDENTAIADEVLQNLYRINAMVATGMSAEQAGAVMNMPINGKTESFGKDQMQNFFYTYIMIFALYMVILLYGQMVTMNVATEKSSRAMELLITSAKPTAMMFGKVLASCIAGLLQLLLIFGSAVVCFRVNASYWDGNGLIASIFDIPVELLVYMLVFFLLGFLIYAFLFGAIGSTVSKLEEVNTAVTPLTFLFIIAFLVVVFSMSSGNVDNLAVKVCSFIPFTSPMAMFTRITMSTVPWYEIAISIAVLIASTVGIGILSAKIYRAGVLMYGTPPKFTTLIKAAWKA